ncbi:MAG TPA: hypothetical protein VG293_01735 [Solirubrobacteraceae bacterium]|nr:hypothetical protein [Solirubrobacteraceae bacterium]
MAATRSEIVTQAGNTETPVVPGQQAAPGSLDQVAGGLRVQDTSTQTDYTLIFNLYAESDTDVSVTSACSGTMTVIPTTSAG